jgi:cellobiose-specific phosphotransferase system component IIC
MQFFPNSILQTGVKDIGPNVSKPFNQMLPPFAVLPGAQGISWLLHKQRAQR